MNVLSFIIPAYNSQAFLDKCLSSMIVAELLEKMEILIVNDGSTDATEEIARSYVERYPNTVRLICQENKGHGGALNTGCAAARGKYLKVIDADDWVQTQSLPAFLAELESCEADVVLTHHHTIDVGTGEVKTWRNYPEEFGKAYDLDQVMSHWKCFDRSLTFHGITYRRDFYQTHSSPLLEHVFYEDHEYATFPCCRARTLVCLDLIVYEYRIGDAAQSVSQINQLKRLPHTEAVIRRMTESYGKLPEGAGKRYAAMKIQGLVLSYLTTTLLTNPDRKVGAEQARAMMDYCRIAAPEAAALAEAKYRAFLWMNRFHVRKATWDRILNSRLYNRIRRNHTFE